MNDFREIVWHHPKSGHYYQIVDFGVNEEDVTPRVAYRRLDDHGNLQPPTFYRVPEVFFDGRFRMVASQPEASEKSLAKPIFDEHMKFEGFGRTSAELKDARGEILEVGDRVKLAPMKNGHTWKSHSWPREVLSIVEITSEGYIILEDQPNMRYLAYGFLKVVEDDRATDRKAGDEMGTG